MPANRPVLKISDFSDCQKYCLGTGEGKFRDKLDYHIATQTGTYDPGVVTPLDDSIPATDGTTVGTLADGFTNIIITHGGVIEEDWLDPELGRIVVKYKFDCVEQSWEIVDQDFPDDVYPDPDGPGYIHKDILGREKLILFHLTLTQDSTGDSIINLTDNEGEVIDSINLCDIPCAPQVPVANPLVTTGDCGWVNIKVDASCAPNNYTVNLLNIDSNLIATTDVVGNIIVKIKNTQISGPFNISYRTTCPDGNTTDSTVTVQWTAPTVTFFPIAISVIDTVPYVGNVSQSTTQCTNGPVKAFHVTRQPDNGHVNMAKDGAYSYTPHVGFIGVDTFDFSVSCCDCCDDEIPFDQTFNVNVTKADIGISTVHVCRDNPKTFNIASNVVCELESVVTVREATLQGGSITQNGVLLSTGDLLDETADIVYTPPTGFAGTDVFTFDVVCGEQVVGIGYVYFNVEVALAVDNTVIDIPSRDPYNGDVSTSDLKCVLGESTYTVITQPTQGTVDMNADGTYTYTWVGPDCGTDSFSYQLDCTNCINIGQATETLELLCCAEAVPVEELLASDTTYDISTEDTECPIGVRSYQYQPDSAVNVEVSVAPTGIHTITSFSDDCVGDVQWEYNYDLLCDFPCTEANVSGTCPACAEPVDITDSGKTGSLLPLITACEWHNTTFALSGAPVASDGADITVTIAEDGTYVVDFTTCEDGQTFTFNYETFCGNVSCGIKTVTGDCSQCPLQCEGKSCGPDGCGGECGICPGNSECIGGICVENCTSDVCNISIQSDGTSSQQFGPYSNNGCGPVEVFIGFHSVLAVDSLTATSSGGDVFSVINHQTLHIGNANNPPNDGYFPAYGSVTVPAGGTLTIEVDSNGQVDTVWGLSAGCKCACSVFDDPFADPSAQNFPYTINTLRAVKQHLICNRPITTTGGYWRLGSNGPLYAINGQSDIYYSTFCGDTQLFATKEGGGSCATCTDVSECTSQASGCKQVVCQNGCCITTTIPNYCGTGTCCQSDGSCVACSSG